MSAEGRQEPAAVDVAALHNLSAVLRARGDEVQAALVDKAAVALLAQATQTSTEQEHTGQLEQLAREQGNSDAASCNTEVEIESPVTEMEVQKVTPAAAQEAKTAADVQPARDVLLHRHEEKIGQHLHTKVYTPAHFSLLRLVGRMSKRVCRLIEQSIKYVHNDDGTKTRQKLLPGSLVPAPSLFALKDIIAEEAASEARSRRLALLPALVALLPAVTQQLQCPLASAAEVPLEAALPLPDVRVRRRHATFALEGYSKTRRTVRRAARLEPAPRRRTAAATRRLAPCAPSPKPHPCRPTLPTCRPTSTGRPSLRSSSGAPFGTRRRPKPWPPWRARLSSPRAPPKAFNFCTSNATAIEIRPFQTGQCETVFSEPRIEIRHRHPPQSSRSCGPHSALAVVSNTNTNG